MEARTVLGCSGRRRSAAVTRKTPIALLLLAALVVPVASLSPAAADQPSPAQASLSALTAKVDAAAGRVHQLTQDLDQARLQVGATSARLVAVGNQYNATVQSVQANRTVLVNQAIQAYMVGDIPVNLMTSVQAGDVTVNREYEQIASGDLTDTGDQLRQLEVQLQSQQVAMRAAQQANVDAANNLSALRANAVSVATAAQGQLESLQAQITAAQQAAAAQEAAAASAAQAASAASAAASAASAKPAAPNPQGLPVNNGLLSVVNQAGGLPIATPVATNSGGSGSTGGPAASGGAGGVWLSLRMCESSGNYQENTGNGFFGAYQFSQSTWTGLGYPGRPDQEPPSMQDEAAMKDQSLSGWGQWPACAAALGLL
ncbi:MAG: transglycosylase family protein [Acidimicrobiales bacterium]